MATFVTGDTSPALSGTCTSDGAPANLAGASVEIHIRWNDNSTVTKTAAVTDAANGVWSYVWQAGDLSIPGRAKVEAQVTFSNGKIQTFGPVSFAVLEQIA